MANSRQGVPEPFLGPGIYRAASREALFRSLLDLRQVAAGQDREEARRPELVSQNQQSLHDRA